MVGDHAGKRIFLPWFPWWDVPVPVQEEAVSY
jgi:hypothetical protein